MDRDYRPELPQGVDSASLSIMKTSALLMACCLTFALACSNPYPPPPSTTRVEVVETLHGVEFADPYRWLEDQESPETRAWIDAQNAYAEQIVGEGPLREKLRSRLGDLLRQPEFGAPKKGGDFEYFTMRRPE
ncbi:MAG: hypothetical protein ACRD21_23105, partial [Vicinamibacteria bacterium]